MILIGATIFKILPNDDPCTLLMREFDPDAVELVYWGTMEESGGRVTIGEWAISLESATFLYGEPTWVCPD